MFINYKGMLCILSLFFQFNVPHLSLLWARPWFHHHTESNKRITYTRKRQIEVFKYISYTIKPLEYSKTSTEEPTKEKEMAITTLLSQGNWQEIFFPEIILFGHKDKTLSVFWKTQDTNFQQFLSTWWCSSQKSRIKVQRTLIHYQFLRGRHWLQ